MNIICLDMDDLSNLEVFAFCDQVRDDYCEAVLDGDDADWQQACADAVLTMTEEARRRGIRPGSVH